MSFNSIVFNLVFNLDVVSLTALLNDSSWFQFSSYLRFPVVSHFLLSNRVKASFCLLSQWESRSVGAGEVPGG